MTDEQLNTLITAINAQTAAINRLTEEVSAMAAATNDIWETMDAVTGEYNGNRWVFVQKIE